MDSGATAKCSCEHCQTRLEFPVEAGGTEIDCPACGHKTTLVVPDQDEAPSSFEMGGGIAMDGIIHAFGGSITRTRASPLYTLGLGLVSLMMVLLPLLYLAMVGTAIWATWYWASHFTWMVRYSGGSARLYVITCFAYGTLLFAGGVLVFFMIKPLFARRAPHAQPLALNAGAEPVLFAFVTQLCRAVGAPFPRRIDVDCHLNASASFRRGLRSLLSNDLVLTIGIPLAAGLSVRELAAVIAHEFGHFTQGLGMRLSYVIRSVNGWFARVIYERDTWDLTLEEWAETENAWAAMVVGCARLAIGFSRAVLKVLMFTGHGISCFMLRQMEYDADRYEMRLAGSDTFEAVVRRFALMELALQISYKNIRTKWNLNRAPPDDLSAYLLNHLAQVPESVRAQLDDRLGLARTGLLDTHPSDGDRIRCARQAGEPGIIHLEGEARDLFGNFDVLSKQVTHLHYSDDLGLPMGFAILQPVKPDAPSATPQQERAPEPPAEAAAAPSGLRLKLRPPASTEPARDNPSG